MRLFAIRYSGIGVIRAHALLENAFLQYPHVWHRWPETPRFLAACADVAAEEIPLVNEWTIAWVFPEHAYTECGTGTRDTFSHQSECRAWDVHADHALRSNRYSCVLEDRWLLLPRSPLQILTDRSLSLLSLATDYFC